MPLLPALWSIVKGVWFALDGLRKVLHLVLLLALFGVLLAASQSELPYVPDSAALVLSPQGYLVEELSAIRSTGHFRVPRAATTRKPASAIRGRR